MTVAYYNTLSDGSFRLEPGEHGSATQLSHDFHFDPPNDIVLSSSTGRPVLCYRVHPGNAQELELSVKTNGRQSGPMERLTGGNPHTYMEVLDHNHFTTGRNIFRFEIANRGAGSLRVSDVIIWYLRSE